MSHDDRIRQLTGLFIEDLRLPIETSLQRLLADLMDIAAHDRTAAVDEALRKAAGDHEAALAAALEAARHEREQAIEGVCADLAHEHGGALDALRADLAGHHDEALQALRADLVRTHEEALDAQRLDLAQRHEEALHALRDEAAADHAAADAAAAAAFAALEHDRDAARATIAELTDQLAAARAQHEQLTQLAHAESEAAAETDGYALETRAVERQAVLACTERMVAATRALDGARTLSEILTALVDHASSESIRVAVLLVQGGHLRGWRFAGLGDVQPAAVDLPVERAGLLGRAVETAAPASTGDAGDQTHGSLPSFLVAPAGRVGLALPIVVGGRVVAVLYADDAGSEAPVVPSNWPEVAEVLARHAGRCLEVLTLSRAGVARPFEEARPKAHYAAAETDEAQEEESARRHARLLISEIKLYNEELVERGRREGNLASLLGSEIERARRLYEEKIPAAVRQRVECFDEEIVRTLAGGDRTLLGQAT